MSHRATRRVARRWSVPALAALGLHGLLWVLLARVGPLATEAGANPEVPPIDVVFSAPDERELRRFTELPEDRADVPPESPELISNVDSRARDRVLGGEDENPRLEGVAESPAVAIPAGDPAAIQALPGPDEEAAHKAPAPDARDVAAAEVREPAPQRRDARPEPPAKPWGGVPQVALQSPGSSAPLDGTISLSTTDWAYGDWLVAFRRAFMPNWRPPSGYRWMLIHGRTVAEIRIAKSGAMRGVDIIGREGHQALHDASERAIRKTAPFQPLPDDFPDEELVLRLELVYPKVWR